MDFGAIGMIMGHEMTHGFDVQGRLYDENGVLSGWLWEEETYKERTDCLVRQFSQYSIDGTNVSKLLCERHISSSSKEEP